MNHGPVTERSQDRKSNKQKSKSVEERDVRVGVEVGVGGDVGVSNQIYIYHGFSDSERGLSILARFDTYRKILIHKAPVEKAEEETKMTSNAHNYAIQRETDRQTDRQTETETQRETETL